MRKNCDHCFLRGHTKEECFKLVGYLEGSDKPRGKPKKMKTGGVSKRNNNSNNNKMVMNVTKQVPESAHETPLG